MAYTTINKSTDYFNTKLYTGNGSAGNAQTGIGHQPDFVWLKSRTNTEYHNLYDSVRGATKRLVSNLNSAETTLSGLTSFNSDGFTVGAADTANQNSQNFVAWNWKGNGAGSANTDGSINTTATSVNTTAGFSISTYTGTGSNATVGHGLGSVPKMIIVKRTSASDVWRVYHGSIGATKHLVLNTTAAEATGSNVWNDTAPTSSVFSISTDSAVNASGGTYVAYCFAEKTGYSKFGSYTGNGNANGTFVYTGFKPAWVMVKVTSTANNWLMYDNKRDTFNPTDNYLSADLSGAEEADSAIDVDFLSNGFKCYGTSSALNSSGASYIYMAFGQSLVGSNNVPCTAR